MAIEPAVHTPQRVSTPTRGRKRSAPRPALVLAVRLYLLLAGLSVAVLTVLAYSTPYFDLDLSIERAIQSVRTPWLDAFTAIASWLGFVPQVDVMVLIVAAGLFVGHRRIEAAMTLFAAGGAGVIFLVMAPLIHRPRPSPELVSVTTQIGLGGYPSGHTLTMTAFYGFLIYLAFSELRSPLLRTLITVPALLVIVGIGYGRIYVGEHWPSDVLAGYLLGTLWLGLSIAVYRAWRRRRQLE